MMIKGPSSLLAGVVVVLSAAVAWPCSGPVCDRPGTLALIDGGLPANFPLLVTDMWDTSSFVGGDALQLAREEDGGFVPVPVQLRAVDWRTLAVDASQLVEGVRHRVSRRSSCDAFFPSDGGIVDEFVVAPPRTFLPQAVQLEVQDAGLGLVAQSSGPTCSEGVASSFARFRFQVDPRSAQDLAFFDWHLALVPRNGGAPIEWHHESAGALLADGNLRREPDSHLGGRRISTVFHTCGTLSFPSITPDPGAPAGRYRAVLSARLAGTDAGFETQSGEFELLTCDGGTAEEPTDGGTSSVDGGDAVTLDGGAIAIGPAAPRGCSVGGSTLLLWLAVLVLRRR